MRIRVESQHGRYFAVDRGIIDDPRLSFRAKGLLVSLLCQTSNGNSNPAGILGSAQEGEEAMRRALAELEEAGYYRRIEEPGASVPTDVFYEVSRTPLLGSLDHGTRPLPVDLSPAADSKVDSPPVPAKAETVSPVERIIGRLNELRKRSWDWAKYTPLSARYAKNVEHIHGRLKDGFTEEDLILVLEYIATIDGGKEESRKYFDCVTPFNTKNFERNLAMARDWEARDRHAPGDTRRDAGLSRGASYYERLEGGT